MTEQEKQLYLKTKERFRRLGKENPADVILALAGEVEDSSNKIHQLEEALEAVQKPSKESLWGLNLENLKVGTFGDPEDYETMLRYWKAQEEAGYPYASENVQYFTDLVKYKEQSQEREVPEQ